MESLVRFLHLRGSVLGICCLMLLTLQSIACTDRGNPVEVDQVQKIRLPDFDVRTTVFVSMGRVLFLSCNSITNAVQVLKLDSSSGKLEVINTMTIGGEVNKYWGRTSITFLSPQTMAFLVSTGVKTASLLLYSSDQGFRLIWNGNVDYDKLFVRSDGDLLMLLSDNVPLLIEKSGAVKKLRIEHSKNINVQVLDIDVIKKGLAAVLDEYGIIHVFSEDGKYLTQQSPRKWPQQDRRKFLFATDQVLLVKMQSLGADLFGDTLEVFRWDESIHNLKLTQNIKLPRVGYAINTSGSYLQLWNNKGNEILLGNTKNKLIEFKRIDLDVCPCDFVSSDAFDRQVYVIDSKNWLRSYIIREQE